MRAIITWLLIFSGIAIHTFTTSAQNTENQIINKEVLPQLIDSIANVITQNYISEEMGVQMANHIKMKLKNGAYEQLTYQEFGEAITSDLVEISNDLHMIVYYFLEKKRSPESLLSIKLDKRGSLSNYGYVENKLLKDNIGYLKIAHFTKWKFLSPAKKMVDASLQLLQNADALIIDVRGNPGGFEQIVAYLVSYFLGGDAFKLQEYYCKYIDQTSSIQTTAEVAGKKLTSIPIYVLIDKGTGSAAESMAYILKHLNRATLVGETTAGAGNGAAFFRISNELAINISVCETINVITKRSWEQTGVVPHIASTSADAYQKALTLARPAAQKYRTQLIEKYETLLNEMDEAMQNYVAGSSDKAIIQRIQKCKNEGLISESVINNLGYEFLAQKGKAALAEAIFKTNTLLYPNSANVFDSYAEALVKNGKLKHAIENYQKAVDLGKLNNDPNLKVYLENLKKVKNMD